MVRSTTALATLASLMMCAASASAQSHYTVTGLGNLGLDGAFANGLSENGQVVGYAYRMDASTMTFTAVTPYVYRQGTMTPLGGFNGLAVLANGVNSAGQLAGQSYTVDPATGGLIYQRALLIDGAQTSDIGTLGGTRATARTINEAGQIAGVSRIAGSSLTHAFLYSNGVMTDLGAPIGGRSTAVAINASGLVAGTVTFAGTTVIHPAIFQNGQYTDLGSFGGDIAASTGINDAGEVVGYAGLSDTVSHAFLYSGGVMQDLGSFAGREVTMARDINNRGQIIGLSFNNDERDNQVFLREGGQTYDLNALLDPVLAAGWTITGVYALNDSGQIVGDGILNGVRQAVLLTPVPELPAAPMLAAGLAALLWLQRRRPAAR